MKRTETIGDKRASTAEKQEGPIYQGEQDLMAFWSLWEMGWRKRLALGSGPG